MTAPSPSPARIRTLIVDDEPLARQLLTAMLRAHPDIELIGEAASGTAAVEAVSTLRPDLLFLDVQMPGLDGFEVLRALAPAGLPEVIFVTAFDQYALRAFEVHALDYLLKPFDDERLGAALDRARRHITRPDHAADTHRILELLQELQRRDRYLERLVIRSGERAILQPVAQIDWIEADGKYLNVHVGKQKHVIRDTLTQISGLLDPAKFLRVSRSAIVNIASIREIQPWFRGELVIIMRDGAQIPSTRAFRDGVKRLLGHDV